MLADLVSTRLRRSETRYSVNDYLTDLATSVTYNGVTYPLGGGGGYPLGLGGWASTWRTGLVEEISETLPGYAAALRSSPPAFAAQMVRALVLSGARFTFRNLPSHKTPRRLFGTQALSLLERPWTNATTGQMLARMEWHAGLAGNAYVVRRPDRLRVLRPDWVAIVFGSHQEPEAAAYALDGELLGYVYANGGFPAAQRLTTILPRDCGHWSPLPDPTGAEIGMSWLTPALRDIQGDRAAAEHKIAFFRQGAQPNLVVKGLAMPDGKPFATRQQYQDVVDMLESRHAGSTNAFRTLYLTAGADATVIGSDLRQVDFKQVVGAGETRLAFLSRVPAPILGIAEGLAGSSLNAGNFGMARRIFADTWVTPTLQDLVGCMAGLLDVPRDAELWYDTADIPLLRDDARDLAEIIKEQMLAVESGTRAGFEADAVVRAVAGNDINALLGHHSGLFSVQMQPAGGGGDGGQAPTEPPALNLRRPAAIEAAPSTERPPAQEVTVRHVVDIHVDGHDTRGPDTPDGETRAVLWALDQLEGESRTSPFVEAKHPRIPTGHVGGGRFRRLADRVFEALRQWAKGEGADNPLADLTLPQLRDVARERGIRVRRRPAGEDEQILKNELTNAILDQVRQGGVGEAPAGATKAVKKAAKKAAPAAPAKATTPGPAPRRGDAALDAVPYRMRVRGPDSSKGITREKMDKALSAYSGFNYGRVNSQLRAGEVDDPTARRLIRAIDAAMASSQLDEPIEVRRVIRGHASSFGGVWRADMTGVEYQDLAYVSTSASPDIAALPGHRSPSAAILTIRVPAGTRAVSLAPDADYDIEKEVLLDRGLTYRVTGDRIVDGRRHLDVEVVPSHPVAPAKAAAPRVASGAAKKAASRAPRVVDVEQAARDRQARIDHARGYGEVLAEADELIHNEASPRALAHRLRSRARLHGIEPDLEAAIAAAESGDNDRVRAEIAALAGRERVRQVASAGAVARFDPAKHSPIADSRIELGARVRVVRPGWSYRVAAGDTVTVRPVVEAVPAKVAKVAAPRAAKKAAPAAVPKKVAPPGGRRLTNTEADHLLTAETGGGHVLTSDRTRISLERDGFIDDQDRITETGRAALAAHVWPQSPYTAAGELFSLRDDPDALLAALEAKNVTQLRALFPVMRIPEPGSHTAPNLNRLFALPRTGQRADAPHMRAALLRHFARISAAMVDAAVGRDTEARLRALADEIEARPAKALPRAAARKAAPRLSTDPAVREAQIDNRVRQAYRELREPGQWVGLADLRERLTGLSREEQDAALIRLATSRDGGRVRIVPIANQKVLTDRDRAAALRMGGENLNALQIDDPSDRPVPSPVMKVAKAAPRAARKATPRKAATSAVGPRAEGPTIEVVQSTRDLTPTQVWRGENLTPAGRRALDSLGPAGHPRIAAIPDTEGKIREAYRMLAVPGGGSDSYVSLADLRKLIGEQAPRADVDSALKRLDRGPDARLAPQSEARGNAATRIPAAVMIGGAEYNLLHIDDPTLTSPTQFSAVALADELDARRTGGPTDPMMARLSDAELQAEIDRRAAADPFVAGQLAARRGAVALSPAKVAKKAAPAAAPEATVAVSVVEAARRLPSGPDVYYHSGAEDLDLDRDIFLAPTVDASVGYLQGGPGTVTAFRIRPDARLADEDDIQQAAETAFGDIDAKFGYRPYVYELVDMPEVRRQLATDGFAGASYRDLGPDNLYQHDTTVVWDRSAVEVLGRQNVSAAENPANNPAEKATPAASARALGRDLVVEPGFVDDVVTRRDHYVGRSGDPAMSAIAERQGFDGLPQVASRAEIDRLVAAGRPDMRRGLAGSDAKTAAEMHEDLRSGPAYFGLGVYGNGIYFTPIEYVGYGGASDAAMYSDGTPGSMLRATLRPDARVVELADLEREHVAYIESLGNASIADDLSRRIRLRNRDLLDYSPEQQRELVLNDVGRFAAARGYDVIHTENSKRGGYVPEQWIVLNRTALVVQAAGEEIPAATRTRLTVADLRERAKEQGIPIPSGATKADILRLLGFGGEGT